MHKNLTFFSAKIFACFFVVCLHINFPGRIGQLITLFARFAVPLFFMITGYYTVCDDKNKMSEKIDKRLKKIVNLTLTSFIFYFILNILINVKNGTMGNYILQIKNYANILKFLLLNWTTPVIGVGHIWYLFALVYILLILKKVNKYNLYKKSYIVSILIIVGIYIWELIDSYYKLGVSQIYYRNAWLMGFSFFMLGHLMKVKEDKFLLSNKKLIIFSIITITSVLVLLCYEPKIINGDNCLYLFNILTNIFIFVIAINKNNISLFSRAGELDSGNIYIIHYAIIILCGNTISNFDGRFSPIYIFGISYLLSIFYRKIKTKYLKKLIKS